MGDKGCRGMGYLLSYTENILRVCKVYGIMGDEGCRGMD